MDPSQHLSAAGREYPRAWRKADEFRAERGKSFPKWPNWCFLPMAAWHAIVTTQHGHDHATLGTAGDIGRLAALGAWRVTKGVYRFDPDLFDAVTAAPIIGEMPTEVLCRLPEWCGYVETPGLTYDDRPLAGVWAHLEWDATSAEKVDATGALYFDVDSGRKELRLVPHFADGSITNVPVYLGPWTVTEGLEKMDVEGRRQKKILGVDSPEVSADKMRRVSKEISALISLLLYLCSDAPDIVDRNAPGFLPANPAPKRTRKGMRLFAPENTRIWSVGTRIGEQLRADGKTKAGETTRKSPRAHIRRGHWHGYWTGKRQNPEFKYKFVFPTIVGV